MSEHFGKDTFQVVHRCSSCMFVGVPGTPSPCWMDGWMWSCVCAHSHSHHSNKRYRVYTSDTYSSVDAVRHLRYTVRIVTMTMTKVTMVKKISRYIALPALGSCQSNKHRAYAVILIVKVTTGYKQQARTTSVGRNKTRHGWIDTNNWLHNAVDLLIHVSLTA